MNRECSKDDYGSLVILTRVHTRIYAYECPERHRHIPLPEERVRIRLALLSGEINLLTSVMG